MQEKLTKKTNRKKIIGVVIGGVGFIAAALTIAQIFLPETYKKENDPSYLSFMASTVSVDEARCDQAAYAIIPLASIETEDLARGPVCVSKSTSDRRMVSLYRQVEHLRSGAPARWQEIYTSKNIVFPSFIDFDSEVLGILDANGFLLYADLNDGIFLENRFQTLCFKQIYYFPNENRAFANFSVSKRKLKFDLYGICQQVRMGEGLVEGEFDLGGKGNVLGWQPINGLYEPLFQFPQAARSAIAISVSGNLNNYEISHSRIEKVKFNLVRSLMQSNESEVLVSKLENP